MTITDWSETGSRLCRSSFGFGPFLSKPVVFIAGFLQNIKFLGEPMQSYFPEYKPL